MQGVFHGLLAPARYFGKAMPHQSHLARYPVVPDNIKPTLIQRATGAAIRALERFAGLRTFAEGDGRTNSRATGRFQDPWFNKRYLPELQNQQQNNKVLQSTPSKQGDNSQTAAAEAKASLLREKLFTTFQGGALRFLPMDDGITDETPEMRSEYLRILIKEPAVKSAMLSKVISVVSSKMSVLPASEDLMDKRVAKWTEFMLTRCKGGVRKLGENILLFSLTNGHALNEKIYDVFKVKQFADIFPYGYIGLKNLKVKKPEDYRLEVDQFRNIRGVWSNRASRRFNPSYFVISSFMPMYENPAGTSDLRAAIRAYNLIQIAQQLRAIWAEQFSMPLMEGHYPPEDNDAKAFLEAAVQQIRALGWYVAPEGVNIKILDMSARGQSEFQQMIDDLRKEIYLCIVGSYLQAIEGDTVGGAGNSETHKSTMELFQWYLCEYLAEQINDQIIPDFIGLNFSGIEPPRVAFAGITDGDLLQSAAKYQAIKTLGLDLSKKSLREVFGIDSPADEADRIPGDTPQQSQGLDGGSGSLPGAAPDPLAAMKMAEGSGPQDEVFMAGPQMMVMAMKYFGKVKLNDIALAREMRAGADGLTDFGTMMRCAKYFGVSYKDLPDASVFDMEAEINDIETLVLTTLQNPEKTATTFAYVTRCDLDEDFVEVHTPNGAEALSAEEFMNRWPGANKDGEEAKRRAVILTTRPPVIDKGREPETTPEPTKNSDGEGDEEDGRASGQKAGVGANRVPVAPNDMPAGPDGKDVYKLLNLCRDRGAKVMAGMATEAAERMLKTGKTDTFFTDDELEDLTDELEKFMAPADLLGRASVMIRLKKAQAGGDNLERFSETPCGVAETFAEGRLRPMKPAKALDYFKSLVPSMNLNVTRWGDSLRRKTFTMAEATNKQILKRVQKIIADRTNNGDTITGPEAIEAVLQRAGIHPKNPQYPDMVFRTNYMDMHNVAAEEQRLDPDVIDEFPVWRYMGIRDGRQGKDHEVHFNKYYPAKAKFAEVRGERPFNCVLPGNAISGRFTAALKARYSGEAVEILTRSGSRVSLTVNHPVFSENGIIKAGDLYEGMNLWTHCGKDDATHSVNVQDAPALIEEVFNSFKSRRERKAPSSFDLDGDGQFIDGEIEIVRPDFMLMRRGDACEGQSVSDVYFKLADSGRVRTSDLSVSRCFSHTRPFGGFGLAMRPYRNTRFDESRPHTPSGDAESLSNFIFRDSRGVGSGKFPNIDPFTEKFLSIGTASSLDASLPEPVRNGLPFDGKLTAKLLSSRASEVTLDEIVEIRRFHYDGPVYDMETTVGYFSCGIGKATIIVRNCRCQAVPVYKAEWAKLKARGVKVAKFSEMLDETIDMADAAVVAATKTVVKLSEMPVVENGENPLFDHFSEEEHTYCSTQFNLPHAMGLRAMGMADRIKDEDLVDKGREDEPHITVVYGIHDEASRDVIGEILKNQKPIVVTLRKSSLFEKEDCDVVKLDVDSPELHELREAILEACPNTQTYPEYQPHVTLAYVKKGAGVAYTGLLDMDGEKVKLAEFCFCDRDEGKTVFKLGGDASKFAEIYHGPNPPGDAKSWQPMQAGPRGGKRWKRITTNKPTVKAKPESKGKSSGSIMTYEAAAIKLRPAMQKALSGGKIKSKLSKQETGKIGEAVGLAWLKSQGTKDVSAMSLRKDEKAVDMVSKKDGLVIEAKAGFAGNSPGAQQWRLTIGEPSQEEKAWFKSASPAAKAKYNAKKQQMIHERKKALIDQLSKKIGKKIQPITVTTIINPDTKTADVYRFDGFHDRIGWNSPLAKSGYQGSFTYG